MRRETRNTQPQITADELSKWNEGRNYVALTSLLLLLAWTSVPLKHGSTNAGFSPNWTRQQRCHQSKLFWTKFQTISSLRNTFCMTVYYFSHTTRVDCLRNAVSVGLHEQQTDENAAFVMLSPKMIEHQLGPMRDKMSCNHNSFRNQILKRRIIVLIRQCMPKQAWDRFRRNWTWQ